MNRRARIVLPIAATVAIVATLAWFWAGSLVPASYSAAAMGTPEYGGGPRDPRSTHDHQLPPGQSGRMITELVAPPGRADVVVGLVTRQQPLQIGGRIGGRTVPGFTVNGTSPGPTIWATRGQLVEVRLRNESVTAGVALHWHGLDVPNAMDGVAGVTQDAVPVGGRFTYRFVAGQAGTYWYHAHQVSNPQVAGGLFGALVILPARASSGTEVVAAAHTYAGIRTVNGKAEDLRVAAAPGERVRVRVINTDNAAMEVWASTPYRVLAVDGTDVHEPGEIVDRSLTLTSGGRADLEVTAPADGSAARVQLSQATAVVIGTGLIGSGADPGLPARPGAELDLLSYGTPTPLSFDPAKADRRFDYVVDRRPGFVRGRPGMWWAINGQLYPHVPMYVVREGDVATMRIENRSSEPHPMHLHGHHVVVLSRDGVPATGSPWWVDSLHVEPGQRYEIAFVADNPGIWMDHCHNLTHAEEGMVAHLMYEGWDTPFRIGGAASNQPE